MGSSLTYFASKRAAVPVGIGANLNSIPGLKDATVWVVPKEGPFDKPPSVDATAPATAASVKVPVTDFWKDSPVVLHLLRRFGCPLCRQGGLEISSIAPILTAHNVRLVGIGLGYNSLDGFMEGNYWRGNELYVDDEKVLYNALKLGKQNILGMTDSHALKRLKESKEDKITGNYQGDGMQLGGTYVIDKGGNILMEFQQKGFGDHPTLESILEALKISKDELKNKIGA